MNRGRRQLWSAAAALGGGLALAAFLLAGSHFDTDPELARWLGTLGLAAALATVVLFAWLDRLFIGAAGTLARNLETAAAGSAPRRRLLGEPPGAFAALFEAVGRVLDRLDEAEARVGEERARATAALEEERRRLAAILRDLAEGLICCRPDGRIVLYNDAAVMLLDAPAALGLGRSVFGLLSRTVLAHHLALLRRENGARAVAPPVSEPFLCTTTGGDRILRCRLSLVESAGGPAGSEGFVLVFEDAGDRLLRTSAEPFLERIATSWRGPLGSLRAAAELLMERLAGDEEGRGFARIVIEESQRLERTLQALGEDARSFVLNQWPLYDVEIADFAELVQERLRERGLAIELRLSGPPLWFAADSFVLAEFVVGFLEELARTAQVHEAELVAAAAEDTIVLDLRWRGALIPARRFEDWLDRPIFARLHLSARELMARHGASPWIAPTPDRQGGFLRLELPKPTGLHAVGHRPPLPPRPEFYDFELPSASSGDIAARPLRELDYVVFDTETTGLDPGSDELVQVSGVRVVNGRILKGEIFDALVDPGRPIPPQSTRIHGITDEMVAGRPPPPIVIARFKEFAGDAILVAHNAAFDLAFMRKWEGEAGVRLDNPVLDTLLLSAALHEDGDHSLDGLAERLGVTVRGRHTALGDALVTAEVLVRLFDLLAMRGIRTFGEAVEATRQAAARRQRLAGDAGEP